MIQVIFAACSLLYRPANVFLPARATAFQVQTSLEAMTDAVNISSAFQLRKSIVSSDADDIVFDAISGSRSGRVSTLHMQNCLKTWTIEDFESCLLQAQCSVLVAQMSLVIGKCIGVALIFRIVCDIVVS